MKIEPRDDLDRAIDEALQSMMAGEPQRVDAATVRAALEPRRRSSIPLWFAAAAVLVVGLLLILRSPARPTQTPTASIDRPQGASVVSPRTGPPTEITLTPSREEPKISRTARSRVIPEPIEPDYEGLPRLAIASLDTPTPLVTSGLEASSLVIPNLQIAPLTVSTLTTENDNKQ